MSTVAPEAPPSLAVAAPAPAVSHAAILPTAPPAAAVAPGDVEITDFGISVHHLDRLLGGLLLATAPRIDWAKLLRRTFAIDVLRCAHGAGRPRLLAAIPEKATAQKNLEHLGLPADPTAPRARSPDQGELFSWRGAPGGATSPPRARPRSRARTPGTRRTCGREAARRPRLDAVNLIA